MKHRLLVVHLPRARQWLFSRFALSMIAWGAFILWLFSLSACSREPDQAVINFVQRIKQEKAGEIEKLPTFEKFEPYKYTASNLRSPFEAQIPMQAKNVAAKKIGPTPDMKRPKEPLESYSLEALHMVGTIQRNKDYWALIKDPHGLVHHVSVGNHIGENFGRIDKISEKEITVHEWVSDGEGGFRERDVKLHLSD